MESPIEPLIRGKQIAGRVTELCREIEKTYAHESNIIIIGIFSAVFMFLADLAREIRLPVTMDFLGLSRYRTGKNPGDIRVYYEPRINLVDKHVLIVDCIIDKGVTLDFATNYISQHQPSSVKTCVFLSKKSTRECDIEVDFTGFFIPDEFVFGYGLDMHGEYRQLPYIGYRK